MKNSFRHCSIFLLISSTLLKFQRTFILLLLDEKNTSCKNIAVIMIYSGIKDNDLMCKLISNLFTDHSECCVACVTRVSVNGSILQIAKSIFKLFSILHSGYISSATTQWVTRAYSKSAPAYGNDT